MPYLLEMKNITKTFGSVKAIDNVSLRLNAGEIVSLCGENGSGKSTLMKVLCGIYPHGSYEGEIIFAGEEIQASHIRDTERKGIAIIHQELAWAHGELRVPPGKPVYRQTLRRIDRAGKYLPG